MPEVPAPLHIASALGRKVIGLYSPAQPIHPGRWMPVGSQANFIENETSILNGYLDIQPEKVIQQTEELFGSE